MEKKTECYILDMITATFEALILINNTIPCIIKFEDNYTYITAKEIDFSFIENVLAKFV